MERSEVACHVGVGTVLVRRYELLQEIGRGGCAVVFEAHDHRLDRLVAIKMPIGVANDSAKMTRFAREARVIASIHHPNVCAVLDTGMTEDGLPFLVMERLFGESLRASVARAGQLGIHDAIAVGLQLLSALDAVHAAGIVHRDIKPDNIILVTRHGCDPLVKLLDFGLCRRAASRRTQAEETMTCDGAIVGTPEYMAPEQVLGSVSIDVRVDLYAVGVVLYEALTGDRAFFSKNLREILTGVMSKKIAPLRHFRRDAPASLEAVVARAMERNPACRYQTAAELQRDLIAIKNELLAAAQVHRRSSSAATPVVDGWELPTTRYQRPEHYRTGERAALPPEYDRSGEKPVVRHDPRAVPRHHRPRLPSVTKTGTDG